MKNLLPFIAATMRSNSTRILIHFLLFFLLLSATGSALNAQGSVKDLLKTAQAQFDKEDYDAAFLTCKQILFKDEKNVEAYVIRGTIFAIRGEYEPAFDDLDYAIARETKNPMAYSIRSEMYRNRGETEKALQDLNVVLVLDPQNVNAYKNRSVIYMNRNMLREALVDLEKGTALAPQSGNLQLLKGYILYRMNEFSLAEVALNRTMELDSTKRAECHTYLGMLAYEKGEFEDAAAEYKFALGIDSMSIFTYFQSANLDFKLGNYAKCIKQLEKCIALDSVYAPAFSLKGECLMRMDDYESAIMYLDTAIMYGEEDKHIYLTIRGDAKRRSDSFEPAVRDYTRALLLDNENFDALIGRAKAYEALAKYDKALRDLEDAYKIAPTNLEIEYMMPVVLSGLGEPEKANLGFVKYLEKVPDDTRAWFAYAAFMDNQKDYATAIEYFNMALATFNSDSGQVYMRLSYCHIYQENTEKANAAINNCLWFPIKGTKRLSGVAYALNALDRPAEALPLLDRAIALDSTHAYAFNNRGKAKLLLGQYEAAIADFDKSIALHNNWTHLPPYNRALAKRALGRYQEAIADFDLAIGYKTDYFEAFNDRGETWEKLNETEKAVADYQAALKIKSDYLPAKLNLERNGF
ncbi:MAG: tetratricopeptide repeat protein [Bacteroidetes bacterium]|nr:tetratricopeptide repeat protein [Bacteroidota bacterium]